MIASRVSANQYPDRSNRLTRTIRSGASLLPALGFCRADVSKPQGIGVYMRVKDECDWLAVSLESIRGIADEIIVVDNGSADGTYEMLQMLVRSDKNHIKLWRRPDLNHCDLSNFALEKTSFRWTFRWDGDMVAHTTGEYSIANLRTRLLALDSRRHYLVYLRHINLSGDLCHQDPKEMVHIEEYIHTFSPSAKFVHPGRFEAVRFPLYYKPLFWYEPYAFHVNVKPAKRMLLRHFWEDWMEEKDYIHFPTLEDYAQSRIEKEFGTSRLEEAQQVCLRRTLKDYIPFDSKRFGPYPELLKPFLEDPAYRIRYENRQITGRDEP